VKEKLIAAGECACVTGVDFVADGGTTRIIHEVLLEDRQGTVKTVP